MTWYILFCDESDYGDYYSTCEAIDEKDAQRKAIIKYFDNWQKTTKDYGSVKEKTLRHQL